MVHQEDIVREIQFVIGIAEEVALIGGQFFELVDKVVAYRAEKSAGYAEGLAGQLKGKRHRPQDVHLVCAFAGGSAHRRFCLSCLILPVIDSSVKLTVSQKANLFVSEVRYVSILLPVLLKAFMVNSLPVPVRYRAGLAVPKLRRVFGEIFA